MFQQTSIPNFASGTYSVKISDKYFPFICTVLEKVFYQFKGSIFPLSDYVVALVCLVYFSMKPQGKSLEWQRISQMFTEMGMPIHLFQLYNLIPDSNYIRLSPTMQLEFGYTTNPIFALAESYAPTALRNSLENIRAYFNANKQLIYWKDNPLNLKDARHKYEITNSLALASNGTVLDVNIYSQSKDFKLSYSFCFSFFFDFKVLNTTNASGQTLDLASLNIFNNVKFLFQNITPAVFDDALNSLVRWYFDGNQNIALPPGPAPRPVSQVRANPPQPGQIAPQNPPAPPAAPSPQPPTNIQSGPPALSRIPSIYTIEQFNLTEIIELFNRVLSVLNARNLALVPQPS